MSVSTTVRTVGSVFAAPTALWYRSSPTLLSSRWTKVAIWTYGPLALIACVWTFLQRSSAPWVHPNPWLGQDWAARTAISLSLGLALAVLVTGMTRVLVKRTRWARTLHSEFRNLLGPLNTTQILCLSLASGIAEELFFRGAIQPAFGLWISALIFGAVHVGPTRSFWPWTLWAFLMGLAFGLIFEATGVLSGAILAHATINYVNMRFMQEHGADLPTPAQ